MLLVSKERRIDHPKVKACCGLKVISYKVIWTTIDALTQIYILFELFQSYFEVIAMTLFFMAGK
jgi:hypothetical protein